MHKKEVFGRSEGGAKGMEMKRNKYLDKLGIDIENYGSIFS